MIKYYLKNPEFDLSRGTEHSAGYDIYADIGSPRTIEPGQRWQVRTGLHLAMPPGVFAMLTSRSGLATKHAICVVNAPGIVDADYRGEVLVHLVNHDRQDHVPYTINPGDRIAQVLFVPVLPDFVEIFHTFSQWTNALTSPHQLWQPQRVNSVEELGETSRGAGGHGSTGR